MLVVLKLFEQDSPHLVRTEQGPSGCISSLFVGVRKRQGHGSHVVVANPAHQKSFSGQVTNSFVSAQTELSPHTIPAQNHIWRGVLVRLLCRDSDMNGELFAHSHAGDRGSPDSLYRWAVCSQTAGVEARPLCCHADSAEEFCRFAHVYATSRGNLSITTHNTIRWIESGLGRRRPSGIR